ncbi:hypothetical protein [Paenibacillus pinistramenti]|uniref:hypothetical protein n=1 Tax=Paenibacillus pinistramenti TaxID=1768003 RepID=UPI001108B36D|nr:hypothetical protein [Paenibacillus pinistramenti]
MQLIQPVNQETCKAYIGQHVCAVLHDGTQIHGVISGVTDQGIEFNGAARGAEAMSAHPQKAKQQPQKDRHPRRKKGTAQPKGKTSAYGAGYGVPYGGAESGAYYGGSGNGYGYGAGYGYGGAYGLEWAAIALLFLIPFIFV